MPATDQEINRLLLEFDRRLSGMLPQRPELQLTALAKLTALMIYRTQPTLELEGEMIKRLADAVQELLLDIHEEAKEKIHNKISFP